MNVIEYLIRRLTDRLYKRGTGISIPFPLSMYVRNGVDVSELNKAGKTGCAEEPSDRILIAGNKSITN